MKNYLRISYFITGLLSGVLLSLYFLIPDLEKSKKEQAEFSYKLILKVDKLLSYAAANEYSNSHDASNSQDRGSYYYSYNYTYGPGYSTHTDEEYTSPLCYTGLRDVISGVCGFRFYKYPFIDNSDWIYYNPPRTIPWELTSPSYTTY